MYQNKNIHTLQTDNFICYLQEIKNKKQKEKATCTNMSYQGTFLTIKYLKQLK